MAFKEYKGLDLVSIGNEVLDRWKKNHAFEKSLELREGAPEFIFFEGPPSANGMPGIHHVMARSIKDAICRYKTQSGYKVNRRAGWDTHGLPVELEIEKKLGISGISTHSLRHTYGTRCIESGMAPVVVQKLMGHTDVSVTLNTYTSVFDTFKSKELEKVNRYYLEENMLNAVKLLKENEDLHTQDEIIK